MTLEEILIANGVSEENAKKIASDMKENKIFTSAEENIDVRYGKLKGDYDQLVNADKESKALIEELQKTAKGNEEIQNQIADYQSKLAAAQEEAKRVRTESAFKVAFANEGVIDPDYLLYKLESQKSDIKFDDDGNVSNLKDLVATLKSQCPTQFKSNEEIIEKPLPEGRHVESKPKDLADAIRMKYENKGE